METANSGTACWYWWLPVNCNLRRNKGRGWGGGNHVKMAIILSKWALAEAARQSALTVYGYVLTLVDIFDKSVMVPLLYISRLFFWQILCRSFFNINYDLTFSMLCNNTWVPSMFPLQFDSSKWLECAQWKPCLSLAGLPAGRGIMSTSSTTIGWKRFAVRNAPELVIITFFLLFLLRKSCTDQVCVCLTPLSVRREAASSSCAFSWASSCWESSWSRTTSLKSASREWTALLFLSCYVCAQLIIWDRLLSQLKRHAECHFALARQTHLPTCLSTLKEQQKTPPV